MLSLHYSHYKYFTYVKEGKKQGSAKAAHSSGLFSTLFSMGGLPPFLGFIPKLMVVQSLALTGQTLWLAFLLLTAVVTLIFCIRLLLTGMVLTAVKHRPALTKKDYLPLLIFTAINLTPLIAPLSIFMPF